LFPVNAGLSAVIFKPTHEIRFDKVWLTDTAEWWVLDIRVSEQFLDATDGCLGCHENKMCALLSWIYFDTRDCCILDIFPNPPVKYDKAKGHLSWVGPSCQHISHFCKKITWAIFVLPPTRAAMASWALDKFGPVIRTGLWGTLPFLLLEKKVSSSQRENLQKVLIYNMYYPVIYSCCWKEAPGCFLFCALQVFLNICLSLYFLLHQTKE
jgi:hypothetical protein